MNLKKCGVCNSGKIVLLLHKYQQCLNCKTAWIIKNPKPQYTKKYYEPKISVVGLIFKPIEKLLYKIRNLYVGFNEKKLWIDVGAGEGNFIKSVSAKRKIGIEVSSAGREMMQKLGIETLDEKGFFKVKNLKAEVISFWHVLEHTEKPWKYLELASKNLSKNGTIVVGIPNVESLDFAVFKKYWFHLAPNHHVWHFSKKGLEILFHKANLKIKYIDYFSPEHSLVGVLQSFINKFSGSYNLLHSIVKRNTYEYRLKLTDIFWICFWMSVGLPLVIIFWLTSVFLKMSGTMVFVLELNKK